MKCFKEPSINVGGSSFIFMPVFFENDLFVHYASEDTIGFCFREENELPTGVIMKNFAEQENRERRH